MADWLLGYIILILAIAFGGYAPNCNARTTNFITQN